MQPINYRAVLGRSTNGLTMKINSFDSLLKLQTDWEYVVSEHCREIPQTKNGLYYYFVLVNYY